MIYYATVDYAKGRGIIPPAYHAIVPSQCEVCGKPLLISLNRKHLICSDVRCPDKLSSRGANMLRSYGLNGVGKTFIKKLVTTYNLYSHLDLFSLTEEQLSFDNTSVLGSKCFRYLQKIRTTKQPFFSAISKCSIPNFDKNSVRLFREFDNLNSLESAVRQQYGLKSFDKLYGDFIDLTCERNYTDDELDFYDNYDSRFCVEDIMLNYKTDYSFIRTPMEKYLMGVFKGSGENAITINEILVKFNYELKLLPKTTTILPVPKKIIPITITGSLCNVGLSRTEYEAELAKIGNGIIMVQVGKAHDSAVYTIADYESSSRTYIEGARRDRIIDSYSFLKLVQDMVNVYR